MTGKRFSLPTVATPTLSGKLQAFGSRSWLYVEGEEFVEVMSLDRRAGVRTMEPRAKNV